MANAVLEAAIAYVDRCWSPVPIPYKQKGPLGKDWGDRTIPARWHATSTARRISAIILGPRSGGLTDVDLDCPETVALAPYVLPSTGAIFGRESKPASHWLYMTDLAQTRSKAIDRYEDVGGKTLVELRTGGVGKAVQTMFPPSTHPSGEAVRWDENGAPAKVDGDDLDRRVRLLAAAALMARHWPQGGDHSDTWGAVGRRLADAGAAPIEIGPLVEGLAKLVREDWRAAKDTAMNVAESFDGSSVKELFGAVLAERLDKFLGAGATEIIEDEGETTFDRPVGRREVTWAQAALRGCVSEVAKTGSGSRNNALNRAAYRLGGMVARGWLERSLVERALLEAAYANGMVADDGSRDSAVATIKSGLDAGMNNPHSNLPDRPDFSTVGDTSCGEGETAFDDGASSSSDGAWVDGADGCMAGDDAQNASGVTLDDFHAYMPTHLFIFAPSGEMWPAVSVNARIPPISVSSKDGKNASVKASAWLDEHRHVEQMTWVPGQPQLIKDRLVSDGGWIERRGVATFNLYRPPTIVSGNADKASKWLDHVHRIYADDAEHILNWLAHRVQRPQEKINHALAMGGAQGVGKDTILEPVKLAIGPWNFAEVSPQQLLGRFNGYVKSVVLRVSEARDLGDVNRFAFYEHMKVYTATPPDVIRVDEKHLREHAVFNVCGVIITTNYKTGGIYLPPDDRRHYVAWTDLTKEDFEPAYWIELYAWYRDGGNQHVAAYLRSRDISSFNPKAPPPQTQAFWEIVDASRAPEDDELADVLDCMGNPDAVTLEVIAMVAPDELRDWLRDRTSRRQIPHRLETAGYVKVRNPGDKGDGRWTVDGKRQAVYAKKALSPVERLRAAQKPHKAPF